MHEHKILREKQLTLKIHKALLEEQNWDQLLLVRVHCKFDQIDHPFPLLLPVTIRTIAFKHA